MLSVFRLYSPFYSMGVYYLKKFFALSAFFFAFIILILKHDTYFLGIKNGFSFCTGILIPSLFPFMFLSSFMVRSKIAVSIGKLFSFFTKPLFYLPGYTAPAMILGLTGGYPTGAKTVKSLLEENLINQEQANRMMYFNVGAGPAFIIGAVGKVLLKSEKIGVIIFICQIIFSILLGIFLGFYSRITKKEFYEVSIRKSENSKIRFSNSLIESCQDAVNSTINMCSPVILFYAFISIINSFNLEKFINLPIFEHIAKLFIPILLEVNSSCNLIAHEFYSPTLIAFAIGWGGLCVHLQIISVLNLEKNFKFLNFMIFRLIQGLGAAGLVHFVISKMGISVQTVQQISNNSVSPALSTSLQGSFALILVCLYFINNTLQIKTCIRKYS